MNGRPTTPRRPIAASTPATTVTAPALPAFRHDKLEAASLSAADQCTVPDAQAASPVANEAAPTAATAPIIVAGAPAPKIPFHNP